MSSYRDGAVIVQASSKQDSDRIVAEINTKCKSLSAEVGKRYYPRMIIYNIPAEVTRENAAQIIQNQNPGLITEDCHIDVRTVLTNKNNGNRRNLIVEVDPKLRKRMMERRIKMMFSMCTAADNIWIRRCYHCSLFHPLGKSQTCTRELCCPKCTGSHALKDCKAPPDEFKCAACTNHNKFRKDGQKYDNKHSVMSRDCPSYQASVRRIQSLIDYDDHDGQQ